MLGFYIVCDYASAYELYEIIFLRSFELHGEFSETAVAIIKGRKRDSETKNSLR